MAIEGLIGLYLYAEADESLRGDRKSANASVERP